MMIEGQAEPIKSEYFRFERLRMLFERRLHGDLKRRSHVLSSSSSLEINLDQLGMQARKDNLSMRLSHRRDSSDAIPAK